jgi:hypothetical protein
VGGYRRDIVHRVLVESGATRIGASTDTEEWVRVVKGTPLVVKLCSGGAATFSTARKFETSRLPSAWTRMR